MKALFGFFEYELRRHLPTVLVGWVLLLPLPLIHRLTEGHWRYWSGDWRQGGALFAQLVVAPLLAVALALSGWAGERSAGTLRWLYARPLSAAALFLGRLVAILLSLVLFLSVAQLAHLQPPLRPLDTSELATLSPVLAHNLSLQTWLSLIGLLTAGALLASALAPSGAAALRVFLAGAAALFLLDALASLPAAGTVSLWEGSVVVGVQRLRTALWVAAFLLAAWAAVKVAPLDWSRHRRAALAGAGPLLLGLLAASFFALHPARFGEPVVHAVRDLGQGVRLELVRSPAMNAHTLAPRLRQEGGAELVLRSVTRGIHDFYVAPRSGAVMLPAQPTFGSGASFLHLLRAGGGTSRVEWLALGRDGEVRAVEVPPEIRGGLRPFGWSPTGTRFAWGSFEGHYLVIADADLRTRAVAVSLPRQAGRFLIADEDLRTRSVAAWSATWVDEQRLLVGPSTTPAWNEDPWSVAGDEGSLQWAVMDTRGRLLASPFDAWSDDWILFPDLMRNAALVPWTKLPVRYRGRVVALILHPDERWLELAALDPASWSLEPVHAIRKPLVPIRAGFGTLEDGSLAWLEPDSAGEESAVTVLPAEGGAPVASCRFRLRRPADWVRFRGAAGGWALWEEGNYLTFFRLGVMPHPSAALPARLLACQLASGRARYLEEPLGPLGARSVDLTAEGLLTPEGVMRLDR